MRRARAGVRMKARARVRKPGMTAERATRRALRRRAALTRREGPLTGAKLPAPPRRRAPRRLLGPRPRRPGPLLRRRGWVDSARGGRQSCLREGLQQPRRARAVSSGEAASGVVTWGLAAGAVSWTDA